MPTSRRPLWPLLLAALLVTALPGVPCAQEYALSLYACQLTREKWEDAIWPDAEYADATIVVAAGSWTLGRFFDEKLSVELEAQVGRYFGDQEHWEVNLPIVGLRWHRFPWERQLATTFAWGIGPSYASEVPPVEREECGSSQRWLIYWYGELTFGLPGSPWELMVRLHHRSDGFGTVADEGGSNALGAGLRYRF